MLTAEDQEDRSLPKKSCGWCDDYGLTERIPLMTLQFEDIKPVTIVGASDGSLKVTEPWVALAIARSEYTSRFDQNCPTCQVLKIAMVGGSSSVDVPVRPAYAGKERSIPLDVSGLDNEKIDVEPYRFILSDTISVVAQLGYGPISKTWAVGPVALQTKDEEGSWKILSSDVRS